MLNHFTETDSTGVRTDWNCETTHRHTSPWTVWHGLNSKSTKTNSSMFGLQQKSKKHVIIN